MSPFVSGNWTLFSFFGRRDADKYIHMNFQYCLNSSWYGWHARRSLNAAATHLKLSGSQHLFIHFFGGAIFDPAWM